MSQLHELDPAASTTSSEFTPSTRTLVVCFDAESVHFTKKSTIIQLCNSAKKADGTIVYYAVRLSPLNFFGGSYHLTTYGSLQRQSNRL
jgi:hypothetical protein